MNLILDTHVFLWLSLTPHKLTSTMRSALSDPNNILHLSLVSVWEMQIKVQIGKLHLPQPIDKFVTLHRSVNNIYSLPILERHVWGMGGLPLHHRDPFDRLLIAQAISEKWDLVSADSIFTKYPVSLLR